MRRIAVAFAPALVAIVAIAAVAAVAARAPSLACGDLCSYYAAGLLAREGAPADAFDPARLDGRHRAVHDLGQRAGPFLYSPLWLIPSAWLAAEPLPKAIATARMAGGLALAAGLLCVLLAVDGWPVRLAVTAAFVLSHAAWVQLIYGNWSFLLFALLAAVALSLRRGSARAGAIAAALALHLKPFVLFALAPAALARRRFAAGVAALALLAGALVLPWTGVSPWVRCAEFLAGRGAAGVTPFYSKSSLSANLARLATEPREWVTPRAPVETLPVRAAFWAGLPLLAWGTRRLRGEPVAALSFGLAWTLLFVPQIWEHTEILLFAALPGLARRFQIALALMLAATFFYNGWQQRLLAAALGGDVGAFPIGLLLWLYPAIHVFVLLAAVASVDRNAGAPAAAA